MKISSLIHPGLHFRRRVATAYREQVDYRREAALRMWVAFIATFVFLRILSYGIRYHFLPFRNMVAALSIDPSPGDDAQRRSSTDDDLHHPTP